MSLSKVLNKILNDVTLIILGFRAWLFGLFHFAFNGIIEDIWNKTGIRPNGPNRWDPQIKGGKKVFKEIRGRVMAHGTLGAAETYMEGLWDVEDLEEMLFRLGRANVHISYVSPLIRFALNFTLKFFNLQTPELAFKNVEKHYDRENEVILSMLGKSLNYTCGDWRNAKTLDEAQTNKMELIARKLKLKPGMRVLDIGCGWGGLAKYLAQNHGVSVVGVTVSKEGALYGQEHCKGYPVEIALMDYREVPSKFGKFDRITTIEMIEHVGVANYRTFFETVNKCLVDDGLFLLQVISQGQEATPQVDPFSNKYIFRNGMTPYPSQIIKYSQGLLTFEDWQSWGNNYYHTLMAWYKNFLEAWPKLSSASGRDDKFFRMWKMYLMASAAAYRARKVENYQIVFSKEGVLGGYDSVR